MAGEVFAFLADDFTEPFLDSWVVDSVVVHPALVTGVIGWIDVNTVDFSFIARQEGFEGLEVVTMNNHVLRTVILLMLPVLVIGVLAVKHAVGNVEVVGDHLVFANPVQFWH